MRIINTSMQVYYKLNDKFFMASDRKGFRMNDIFIDGRDYCIKMIDSDKDLIDVSYMAPELYVILEEATVQD